MGDYGIKISKEGVDVKTAAYHELLMSSQFPMFKLKEQGTANLLMYKTTLSSAINSSQTTIGLTSTAGFRSSGHIWVRDGVLGDQEAIAYTGISGNSLTGCTRGHLGTTAISHGSGSLVMAGYNEFSVAHGLSFPPVHFVFRNVNSDNDTIGGASVDRGKTIMPAQLLFRPVQGMDYIDAWVTTTNLVISINYESAAMLLEPSGSFDRYDFIYMIMADGITDPYYSMV